MFGWLRTPNYDKEAERLLQLSHILSTSSTVSLLDRFPAISAILTRPGLSVRGHWDFFAAVAGLGTGLSLYATARQPSDVKAFTIALVRRAEHWDQQAPAAIDDFQQFVNRNVSAGVDLPTAIGSWVVWNIKSATPSDEELRAAPAIGAIIVNGLRDWNVSGS
jgi:hypothetical protein